MKPDPATCRWLARYFGDVCRNRATHPSLIRLSEEESRKLAMLRDIKLEAGERFTAFVEPPCHPCDGCGYQPITPRTPAWDDPGEDEKEEAK